MKIVKTHFYRDSLKLKSNVHKYQQESVELLNKTIHSCEWFALVFVNIFL